MTLTKEYQAKLLNAESLGHTLQAIDGRKVLTQARLDREQGKYDHWTLEQFQTLEDSLQKHIDACHKQAMQKSERAKTLRVAPVKPESVVRVVEASPVEEKPSAVPGHYYASKSEGFREGLKASFRAVKPSPSPEPSPVKVKTKPEPSPSPMLIPSKGEYWESVYTLTLGKRVYRVSTRTNSQENRFLRIDLVSGRRAKSDNKFLGGLRVCSAGQNTRKKCWQGTLDNWTELKEQFPIRK